MASIVNGTKTAFRDIWTHDILRGYFLCSDAQKYAASHAY